MNRRQLMLGAAALVLSPAAAEGINGGGKAASGGLSNFVIDFVNGVYTVGSTSYTLAQTISRPDLVSGGKLVIPDNDPATTIGILGAFKTRLLAGSFSLVVAVNGLPVVPTNTVCTFFNMQDTDSVVTDLEIYSDSNNGTPFGADYDVIHRRTVSVPGTVLGAGNHKIGLTRSAPYDEISADGTIPPVPVQSRDASAIPTTAWIEACLGGDFNNGTAGGCNILSLKCYSVQTAAQLAVLTT